MSAAASGTTQGTPTGLPHDTARAERVRALAEQHLGERGPLLVILHSVLRHEGWIADQDIQTLADVLNLSRADVLGVVSFYHDFRRTPPPPHRVVICRGEACQARGAEAVHAATAERVADRADTELGEVFCLGNCALGPSGTVDGRLYGRLDADTVDLLLDVEAAR